MKQTIHVDHSPTLVYDISIDDANTVSLVITKQDPKFTAWIRDTPFTEGPLRVKSVSAVALRSEEVFLRGPLSIDLNDGLGIKDTLTLTKHAHYINDVNISLSMAVTAFLKSHPPLTCTSVDDTKETIDHSPFITYTIGIDKNFVTFKINAQCTKFTKWLSDTGGHMSKGILHVQINRFPALDETAVHLRGINPNWDDLNVHYTPTGDPLKFVDKVKLAISGAVEAYRNDTKPRLTLDGPSPISVGPYKVSWDNMCKDLEQIGFHFGEVVIFKNETQRLFAYDPSQDILYMDSSLMTWGLDFVMNYSNHKDEFLHAKKEVVTVDKEYYVPRDD